MKKKVRVKSLPKAQIGLQPSVVLTPEQKAIWYKNQNMFGNPPVMAADVYAGNPNTTGSFNVGMPSFERNTNTSTYADVYMGDPNTTGPFNPGDRKSTRLNSSHVSESRMPSSA